MAGLALKLAPKERVLINGVVVENGPRRAQLLIKTDNAAVLRLRDALEEKDLIGPASRAYYAVQRCVAGELTDEGAHAAVQSLIPELKQLNAEGVPDTLFDTVLSHLKAENCYRAMRCLRPLVDYERGLAAESVESVS